MRVAVVGNMNNNMFALTRHLHDRQIDAELLFAPGYDHFHPKADTFDLADLDFCHSVSWLDNGFYSAEPEVIRSDLRGYDAVLATGAEAAALSLAGVPIDIYFVYGDDVTRYAHLPESFAPQRIAIEQLKSFLKRPHLPVGQMRNGTEFGHLRRAICTAQHVICDRTHDTWDQQMLSLPLEGTLHRLPFPFLYPKPYRTITDLADVHWRSAIEQLRNEHELIVMHHGRHEWTLGEWGYTTKNSHHLILGFEQFVREHRGVKACLATVEYGQDVRASKGLIAELGIADRVVWFPLMYRKDLMYLATHADLCSGEFYDSYLTGGTIVEALSLGKPLIHYRDDSLYSDLPLYPILNAREPTQIAAAIAAYVDDPEGGQKRAQDGAPWVDEYLIHRPLDLISGLLGQGIHSSPVEAGDTASNVS